MKTIIIDDPDNIKFSENLSKILNDGELCDIDNKICYIHSSYKSPREVAEEIKDKYLDYLRTIKEDEKDPLLLFVNIEGKFGGLNRQDQKGVELLMWLRCKHRICYPIILYSFQSNKQLLKRKPEHLIINSEGCYHYQLPNDFSKIKEKIKVKNFEGVKDWHSLKKYLKPAVNLEEFRHREANWWGVKCLWDMHSSVKEGQFKLSYPTNIEKELQKIKNCVADFCYGLGTERIKDYIDKKIKLSYQISELKHKLEEKIDFEEIDILKLNEIIENFNLELGLFKFIGRDPEEIRKNETKIVEVENTKIEIEKIIKELDAIAIKINSQIIKNSIPSFSSNIKILYIDDQANEGWGDIFNYMIFNKLNKKNFKILEVKDVVKTYSKIDSFVEQILINLNSIINPIEIGEKFEPDVILLDLRLFPVWDDSQGKNLINISGCKLLMKIHEKYPGIPVIMTTASNKIWSYEEMMNIGADAFWIKEGIDSNFTIEESAGNYLKLLNLVHNITSNQVYKFLKSIHNDIENLFSNKNLWWENKNWKFKYIFQENNKQYIIIPENTIADKRIVKEILWNSLTLIRQYNQTTLLKIGFDTWAREEWYLSSEIIRNVSYIIELIHGFDKINENIEKIPGVRKFNKLKYKNYDDSVTLNGLEKLTRIRRNDKKGQELYKIRNDASHFSKAKKLKSSDYQSFFKKIINYLNTPPDNKTKLDIRIEKEKIIYDNSGKVINEK